MEDRLFTTKEPAEQPETITEGRKKLTLKLLQSGVKNRENIRLRKA